MKLKHTAIRTFEAAALSLTLALSACGTTQTETADKAQDVLFESDRNQVTDKIKACLDNPSKLLSPEEITECTIALIREAEELSQEFRIQDHSPAQHAATRDAIREHVSKIKKFHTHLERLTTVAIPPLKAPLQKAQQDLEEITTLLEDLAHTRMETSFEFSQKPETPQEIYDFISKCSSVDSTKVTLGDVIACTNILPQILAQYDNHYFYIDESGKTSLNAAANLNQALYQYQNLHDAMSKFHARMMHRYGLVPGTEDYPSNLYRESVLSLWEKFYDYTKIARERTEYIKALQKRPTF